MHFSPLIAAAIVGLTSFASAQEGGLPSCVQNCIPKDLGGCPQLDYDCVCNNNSFIDQLACCVSQCTKSEQETALKLAASICKNSDDLPSAATCAPGLSASSTGTGTASSKTSTSPASTGSAQGGSSSPTPTGAAVRHGVGAGAVAAGLLAFL